MLLKLRKKGNNKEMSLRNCKLPKHNKKSKTNFEGIDKFLQTIVFRRK